MWLQGRLGTGTAEWGPLWAGSQTQAHLAVARAGLHERTPQLAPEHSLFQDRQRDWAWATALHTRLQNTGLERTVLGGRREYWGTHRPGVGVGAVCRGVQL